MLVVIKCKPTDTRLNLECADSFAKAGIDFVCIPVYGELTKSKLAELAVRQLHEMEKQFISERKKNH